MSIKERIKRNNVVKFAAVVKRENKQ